MLLTIAFLAANSTVGKIGGFLETWPTTNFRLLHAAFAAGSGLCFIIFKFVVSPHLETKSA
ncbi:MAG: hypothetical protein ACJ8HQ_01305 [Chthoniobacterales bacterium]